MNDWDDPHAHRRGPIKELIRLPYDIVCMVWVILWALLCMACGYTHSWWLTRKVRRRG